MMGPAKRGRELTGEKGNCAQKTRNRPREKRIPSRRKGKGKRRGEGPLGRSSASPGEKKTEVYRSQIRRRASQPGGRALMGMRQGEMKPRILREGNQNFVGRRLRLRGKEKIQEKTGAGTRTKGKGELIKACCRKKKKGEGKNSKGTPKKEKALRPPRQA